MTVTFIKTNKVNITAVTSKNYQNEFSFAANPSSIFQVCLSCQCVIKQKSDSEILYHVIASKEGVYSIQVVVKELGHTVDDIKGDRLQNIHHLHVLPCVEMTQKTSTVTKRFVGHTFQIPD